ncbi:hypothetical protein JCM10207_006439 [Rhodosporidiobolus poonsookiae]
MMRGREKRRKSKRLFSPSREDWEAARETNPLLASLLPPAIGRYDLPLLLPPPLSQPNPAFSLLGLPHGFSAGKARRQIASLAFPLPLSASLASLFPSAPDELAVKRLWGWIGQRPAAAKEVDAHWRLAHGVSTTAAALHAMGKRESPACALCGEQDTVVHAYFTCTYSAAYWDDVRTHLASTISSAFSADAFSPGEITLGLPALASVVDKAVLPTLRAIVAIALHTLDEARRARIRPVDPALSSPSPSRLASRFLLRLENRLANG